MVRSADRGVIDPAFEVALTFTVPFPVPDVGPMSAHAAPLDAVHEQFDPFVEIPIVPLPPPTPYGAPSADVSTVTLQASASCVTRNACPPIVSVPER